MAVVWKEGGTGHCFICGKDFPGNEVIKHMFDVHYKKEKK